MAQCMHRERLGCQWHAGTAPRGAGKGSGGNSGRWSSSHEDNKAFEVWQQLLVTGSQLVCRAL